MSDFYHNIEEDLALGMVRGDRVLRHIQHQSARIEELEAKAMKASYAVFLEKRRADEAQDKLARALRALPMPDDLQNEYMIERLRIAIERAEAAEDRIGELEAQNELLQQMIANLPPPHPDNTLRNRLAQRREQLKGKTDARPD